MRLTATLSTILLFLVLLQGCGSRNPTIVQRYSMLDTVANSQHLFVKSLNTNSFKLVSIDVTKGCSNEGIMSVYIEGDGLSWETKTKLSDNPTPVNPISAKLMLIDKSECKIYLARPCQYTHDLRCQSKYWSSHRFSQDIIDSYQNVLDKLKITYKIKSFKLVGYSGGGTVVSLLASNRSDISNLITIAGNLNTKEWTSYHNISELNGSLNPIDFVKKLELIPQIHFIGKYDDVIPKNLFDTYLNHFENKSNIYFIESDSNHFNNWEKIYKQWSN